MSSSPSKSQIAIIHVLKSQAHLSEEDYRSMLSGFGVRSSKDLTVESATDFIRKLKTLAPDVNFGPARYSDLRTRQRGWATGPQLRKIEAMWMSVCRVDGDHAAKVKALESFIGKKFGAARMEWIPRELVGKIIYTLQVMQRQKRSKDAGTSEGADDEGRAHAGVGRPRGSDNGCGGVLPEFQEDDGRAF